MCLTILQHLFSRILQALTALLGNNVEATDPCQAGFELSAAFGVNEECSSWIEVDWHAEQRFKHVS